MPCPPFASLLGNAEDVILVGVEGLSNATPGSIYQPSSVLLPRNPIEFVYPHGFMLSRVNNSGDISWHKGSVFIREVFRFEVLGFERVEEDFYKVYFRDVEIGKFKAEALPAGSGHAMNGCSKSISDKLVRTKPLARRIQSSG